MDKYDKEKMKFIEDQVKNLASQYDKLDIFNRQNNPYLQYKDTYCKTKEYQEIQTKKVWWQNHILQLLQDQNTYKIILFKDRDIKENNDMILFILISLYFEIPIAYEFHHLYYKQLELNREYLEKRDKTAKYLKNVKKEMEDNIYSYFNLLCITQEGQEEIEPPLQLTFNRMFNAIDTTIDTINTYNLFSTNDVYYWGNSLWTRNLTDKTGLRQLVLRYSALLQDLMYHSKYKNYNKSSYQLLDYIMPYDDEGINMIYDLTQDEVYKVIKDISIYSERDYMYIFEGYQRYTKSDDSNAITPYINKWKENNLSYEIFIQVYIELIDLYEDVRDELVR